jgi:hypothetical protein
VKKLLLLAIVLRLLVSAFIFHPDIKTYSFQASFLKKGVFNIYSYLVENKKTLPLKDGFVYFPLTYLTLGGYQAVLSPVFGSGFDSWLSDAGVNSFIGNSQIFKYLVLLKLPYLVLDIAIAFLLMRFFESKEEKKKVFYNSDHLCIFQYRYISGNFYTVGVFDDQKTETYTRLTSFGNSFRI